MRQAPRPSRTAGLHSQLPRRERRLPGGRPSPYAHTPAHTPLRHPQVPGDAPYTTAELHPDGLILATGGADSVVRIWELRGQKNVAQFEGHTAPVRGGLLWGFAGGRRLREGSRLRGRAAVWTSGELRGRMYGGGGIEERGAVSRAHHGGEGRARDGGGVFRCGVHWGK